MSSQGMKVATNMPKIVGLLCCGPASLLIGIQGAKFYRNYTSNGEQSGGQSGAHKKGILDRLTDGPHPYIANCSEQQINRIMRTNSVWQGSSEHIKAKRREALGESEDNSVVKRTGCEKFSKQVEEGTVLKRTRSMQSHTA